MALEVSRKKSFIFYFCLINSSAFGDGEGKINQFCFGFANVRACNVVVVGGDGGGAGAAVLVPPPLVGGEHDGGDHHHHQERQPGIPRYTTTQYGVFF